MSSKPNDDFHDSPRGQWWKRGLLAIFVIAVFAIIVTTLANPNPSQDNSSLLTHRISRGDLLVTVIEQGTLESSENTEIKCKVRGSNTVIWVVENGTNVEAGDELVRLDTLLMEEQIAERTKYALWTRSGAEQSRANLERAKLAIGAYEHGDYIVALKLLQKEFAVKEAGLLTARDLLAHEKTMAEAGYKSELDVEEKTFDVTRAELDVDLTATQIEVLEQFTRKEQLAELKGNLKASAARHKANEERVFADNSRLETAEKEMQYCVVKAEKSGMVIHPSSARWKDAPEIEEGATVHKDQVLLLMPDLTQMQVKVGIHESMVDRVKPGLEAIVTVSDRTLKGEVESVATVTSPAGWWTGNQVKYDTIIRLPEGEALNPGMSAGVEVIMARHEDVLTIPVAAVLETTDEYLCWVRTPLGLQRRVLELGDSDDVSILVEGGLTEGEDVVLNPTGSIAEAQEEAARTISESKESKEEADGKKPDVKSESTEQVTS
jgi:HlyD family secretion protein